LILFPPRRLAVLSVVTMWCTSRSRRGVWVNG
jgi:hypothetical protein